jgi:hypothetical protein
MKKSSYTMHHSDRKGYSLTISVHGTDDQELAHFGGLDLHVKATKYMISDNATLSFPEKDGDSLIHEKVAALYLNEVGELLRSKAYPDRLESYSNFDLVQMFLQDRQPLEVQRLIDADNELIRQDKEKPTTIDILTDMMEKTIKNQE